MSHYEDPAQPTPTWKRFPFPRSPWRRTTSESDGSGAGNLFWLAVLFLGCISLICITWGASSAVPTQPGKSLLGRLIIPKLNTSDRIPQIQAEWTPPAETPPPPRIEDVPPPPPPGMLPGHRPQVVSVAEQTPERSPWFQNLESPQITTDLPSVPLSRKEPQDVPVELLFPRVSLDPLVHASMYGLKTGETPMYRMLKTMMLAPYLAATLGVSAPPAQAGGQPGLDDATKKRFEKIETNLATLSELLAKSLQRAETPVAGGSTTNNSIILEKISDVRDVFMTKLGDIRTDIQSINHEIKSTKTDLANFARDVKRVQEDLTTQTVAISSTTNRVASLEQRVEEIAKRKTAQVEAPASTAPIAVASDKAALEELRKEIENLRKALAQSTPTAPSPTRTSLSPPTPNNARVVLVNLYSEDMLFILNNKGHRVSPNATLVVDTIPAGQLTYEVVSPTWGRRPEGTTVTLGANETFTLTAR